MTQYQFDPSTLLDAFHDRPDLDLVREMVGFLYQALIDIEATEVIGAEPHERTVTRTTRRNSSRAKTLSTNTEPDSGVRQRMRTACSTMSCIWPAPAPAPSVTCRGLRASTMTSQSSIRDEMSSNDRARSRIRFAQVRPYFWG